MTDIERLKNLNVPDHPVDCILDTDTYNEIDDQFALSRMMKSDKCRVKGFCAAPFFNHHSVSPADGMERSYNEIMNLLTLDGREDMKSRVFRGSTVYLPDENTPVESEAAHAIVDISKDYSADKPLYIVAIAAITNVASAFLLDRTLAERCVVVWLGGHALHLPGHGANEFNMTQDIAGARVLFNSGAPIVQLPCSGVADAFTVSGPEFEAFFAHKNPLCDYLAKHVYDEVGGLNAKNGVWSRVIWDVTAAAWLCSEGGRFMSQTLIPAPIPQYDKYYSTDPSRPLIAYVNHINRDALLRDLVEKLTK